MIVAVLLTPVLSQRETSFGNVPATNANQQQIGVFQVISKGIIATIHAAVAPKVGKIMQLERFDLGQVGTHHSAEFDYYTGYSRSMSTLTDIFCSTGFISSDSDGRIFSVGGWNGPSLEAVRYVTPCGNPGKFGICDWIEDPNVASLKLPRWYPSALPLASGRVAIIGGTTSPTGLQPPAINQPSVEFLPPLPNEAPIELPLLVETDTFNLYPIAHLLSSGQVFLMAGQRCQLLNQDTFEMIEELPEIPEGKRTYPFTGSSVMLSLTSKNNWESQVLVCGGGSDTKPDAPALKTCGLLNMNDPQEWEMDEMPDARLMPDMTILADGKVLIINGARLGWAGFGNANDPNRVAIIYDPKKPTGNRIEALAESLIPRMYHSISLMVEDGSVVVLGSTPNANANIPGEYPNEQRIEVFYPPYLLTKQPRPVLERIAQQDYVWGNKLLMNVQMTGNPETAIVSLFTNGFVTHSVHQGQRRVELDCTWINKNSFYSVECMIPTSPNVVPPGWYMIFVTDNEMPGIAQWIRVGNDPAQLQNYAQ